MSPGWRQYYWGLMIARALLTYLIFIDVAYNAKLLNLSDAFKQQDSQPLSKNQASSRRSIRSLSVNSNYYKQLASNDNNKTSISEREQEHYLNDQPSNAAECCACDEAKYELVFEGLWSRYTHPDDFPENYWLAHFSDIIGASHSQEFRMWDQDTLATEGVRELAETGNTKKLEAELKQVSSKTRTIIKARELRYPLLNGKTSAVFRTDRQHHLVSILSKLNPSPDWILGVSGLELCQSDCSWASQRVVNLYLWDAGTDSGVTFTAPDLPTRPQERIHPYKKELASKQRNSSSSSSSTSDLVSKQTEQQDGSGSQVMDEPQVEPQASGNYYSADSSVVNPSSNFFSAEMLAHSSKPYARLTITRQRIYEKSCNNSSSSSSSEPAIRKNGGPLSTGGYSSSSVVAANVNPIEWADTTVPSSIDCRYTDWSDWSTCSSNCGRGIRTRTRGFVDESANNNAGCSQMNLIEKEICLSECMGNVTCVTRDWSDWSRCSVTCGQGIRKRTRSPIGQMRRACGRIELTQTEVCVASHNVDCPPPFSESPTNNCHDVSEWSQWSKCSVACGKGTRIRTRQYLRKDGSERYCNNTLIQKTSCTGRLEACHPDNNSKANDFGQQNKMIQHNPNLPVIDCKLSSWSPWSTCSALCGEGKRTRSRYIVQMPQNGGKPCDKKLSRTQKCKDLPPCPPNYPLLSTAITTTKTPATK